MARSNKLKINFLNSDGYTFEISRFLHDYGHACLYYTDYINHPMLSPGWFCKSISDEDVTRMRRLDLSTTSPLAFDIKSKDILTKISASDVIHSMGLYGYWALLTKRPFVYQIFGGDVTRWPFLDDTPEDRARAYLIREILHKATIIWGGYHQKDTYKGLQELGIPKEKVRPLYLPVDSNHFKPLEQSDTISLRKQHDSEGKFVVLLASQLKFNPHAALNYSKGSDLFARAVQEFIKKADKDDIAFWVVDKGPERLEFHKLVEDLGLTPHIRWITPSNRALLPVLFNAADVILDQVWPECGSHGSLALEAMACKKPVFLHLDQDFRRDISMEPLLPNIQITTVEDIRDSLLHLYRQPEKRESIGQAAREFILQEYDAPVVCKKLTGFYREAIEIHAAKQKDRA